ncbi:MAG: efflux RND transporter periplasmic adaptor subunit [Bryobacterales bacterium]|nr:efflux RND transporter periplasmic adaptor subunit [Bryobacterales bacterium]
MKRWLAILFLLAVVLAGVILATRRPGPPEIPFAKVKRERLVSSLATNGKVEPLESSTVRSERDGVLEKVMVSRGESVSAGQVLATLDAREARSELAAAESRVAAAQAELANFERGGRSVELAEIDGSIARFEVDRRKTMRDLETSRRLVEKKAAPASEAQDLEDRLAKINVEIDALARKRKSLAPETDRAAAQARLADARAAVELARKRIDLATIRTPLAGVVFNLPVRPGSFVHAGDLIAEIGRLERLKVIVYVDEPELGRIRAGLPVKVTWDAAPSQTWTGVVDKLPTQVVALGTRQVGEVITLVENPERDLPPGANINAEIQTDVVENALTVPKEALRREGGDFGVFVAGGGKLAWRKVRVGASSATRAAILEGLSEGDAVALPVETDVKPGMEVKAVFP